MKRIVNKWRSRKRVYELVMLLAFAPCTIAQAPVPLKLGDEMRAVAIGPVSSDSDFGRFFDLYHLTCAERFGDQWRLRCVVLEVDGMKFDQEPDWKRTNASHDKSLLQTLKTPTARPFRLLILDYNQTQKVNTVYELSLDTWDAKILMGLGRGGGAEFWDIHKPVELMRVSPESLIEAIRSAGENDLGEARNLAAKSMTLYPAAARVSAVHSALREVVDNEISRRVGDARTADEEKDWPKAIGILRETLSNIPESRDKITNIGRDYCRQGGEAESLGNWQDALTAYHKALDIIPDDYQTIAQLRIAQEKGVANCLSLVRGFESEKNYEMAIKTLNQCGTYLSNDARLRERAFDDELKLAIENLENHRYGEAEKAVAGFLDQYASDSRVRDLATRAAQEIPARFYETHEQAECVILFSSRLTPGSALKSLPKGVRVDWHGHFARKTIDNWYLIDGSDGGFLFRSDPHSLVFKPGQFIRVIGTVQGIERIGTLGSRPVALVVINPERID